MEYDQLEPLFVCTTAKGMWTKLSQIHEQKSASSKLSLLQRFHEYRMSPGDSVVQHVSKIQNMAAQLVDIGEPVSDTTIMAKVLASLSLKYSALQTAWDSVDPDRQTIENLQERLIREESKLTTEDESEEAFSAFKKKKSDSKGGQRQGRDRKDVECFNCKGKGHYARECKKKKRDNKYKLDNSSDSSDCAFIADEKTMTVNVPVDILTETLKIDQDEAWIIDSGASKHITHRRDKL